jgi:eukaryotic-like serine/threonine-protein kinase
MISQTLGHYRILERIGAGGMGEVYRAEDLHLARDVAIKVLPAGTLADEHARRRFRKEAEALSKLNHPNIQTVHDFDTQEGVDFLVVEFIPGPTMAEKLAAGALPEKEIASLGSQIAAALEEAHERGVVHRDLKPGNIKVTPKGQLKVLDFGLAKLLKPFSGTATTESFTESQATAGTLPYMSPEQLRGEGVDHRTDIWAAGVVLYEMATGRRPFAAKLATALAGDIQHKPTTAPSQLNPKVSHRLQDIILKCLEKEPENRYQSAKELLVDLLRLASPTAVVAMARRPAITQRRALLGLGAIGVLLVVLLGLNVGGWRSRLLGRIEPGRIESLAVLPLANLSGDPEQEYFVDGMTEAVIADLAKIKAMKVISRTSVMQYKNSKKSMREIASALQADAVIEGSVMRSADRVRITVQLIDASSDQHLWAESYERDLKNVFALQGEVAQAIAQQVRVVITPQEQVRLVKKRPVDPEVYELYLKGRHIMRRGGLEDVQKAIEHFQSGLAKDPSNALLYTGLADAYIHKMSDVHESPVEATAKARAAAMKALELDDSLAEAHTSLASIKLFYDWDWTGAEVELKRAMELNPGYSLAYRMYGGYLTIVGRHPEALPYFEQARRLDPLYERNYLAQGYSYFMAHKYDEAIEQYRKSFEIEPDPMAYFGLVLALAEKGDYATAISEGEKATKLNDSPLLLTSLASAYARAGRRADSNRILRQLEEISKHQGPAPAWHGTPTAYVCPYEVAGVYAQLGDKDRAFEWLDKALRSRSCMYFLRQDPRLDSIHPDPRFQELLTKMKFPQ